MKLVWKASAIRDFRRLHNFLARENSNAARRAVSRIRAGVKILVTAPLIGRAAEGMEAGYREWFIEFGSGFYPVPGWVLRGAEGKARTTLIIDAGGAVVAGVCVQRVQYRGQSAAMGLGFCVAPSPAGRGLGHWLNAQALGAAVDHDAAWAMEIVARGSSASRKVNDACGLLPLPSESFLFAEREPGDLSTP